MIKKSAVSTATPITVFRYVQAFELQVAVLGSAVQLLFINKDIASSRATVYVQIFIQFVVCQSCQQAYFLDVISSQNSKKKNSRPKTSTNIRTCRS